MGIKKLKSGIVPFVRKSEVVAPFTSIESRALISDSGLKIIGPVERVHINSLNKLIKEKGQDGKPVFEIDNGDSRIRVVGDWTATFDNHGGYIIPSISGDNYIEVTGYCTGLNGLLAFNDANNREFNISVDGDVPYDITNEGTATLAGRNTKTNIIRNIANGLPLDWHTFLIKSTSLSASFALSGLEFLNESEDLTVLSGSAFANGYEYEINSNTVIPTKTTFENVLDANVGTVGGRVSVYIDHSTAEIKKMLTVVGTKQTMLNTDHSNEVEDRIINFREAGRERGDDFSTLGAANSSRAYCFDDGITSLVSQQAYASGEGFFNNANGYVTKFTFIGCGIDLVARTNGTTGTFNISVDGGPDETFTGANNQAFYRRIKIASGLGGGTHNIKITRVSGGDYNFEMKDFVIYKPKKAALPEGAIEIGEYNIMADYIANTSTIGNYDTGIPSGVIRRMPSRELTLQGGMGAVSINVPSIGGIEYVTNSSNSIIKTFFMGSGFEFRFDSGSGMSAAVSVNGITDFSGYTTNVYGGTATFDPNTGIIGGDGVANSGIQLSGLPFGFYEVIIDLGTSSFFSPRGFDIITSIFSPHTTFGNRSIKDLRNFDSRKSVNGNSEIKPKAYVNFSMVPDEMIYSRGISQILDLGSGNHQVFFEEVFNSYNIGVSGTTDTSAMIRNAISNNRSPNKVQMVTFDTSASNVNVTEVTADFIGKLQKEELEE